MITAISSMATRELLAELADAWPRQGGERVTVHSVGGVEAAKRVRAGERYDLVFLADEALAKLETERFLEEGSRQGIAESAIAVAVPDGAPTPAIASEAAVRDAILAAPSIGFSTGPSGDHLLGLFARWGISETVRPRIVLAPPGVPVAALLASGQAALGFQQRSELMHAPGIRIVGELPREIQKMTLFAGAMLASSTNEPARKWLAFVASADAAEAKRRHGLEQPVAPKTAR